METDGCLKSCPAVSTSSKIPCTNLYTPIKFRSSGQDIVFLKKQEPLYKFSVAPSRLGENSPAVLEGNEEPTVLEDKEQKERQELQGNSNGVASENGNGYVKPPEGARVYVGNLPYGVDSEKLGRLFERAGAVWFAEVKYSRVTDESRGFGFVTMCEEENAKRAVEMFHGYDLSGRLLVVNKAVPRGPRSEKVPRVPNRVYVGNLSWNVGDMLLEQVFSKHGKVVSARVLYEPETGNSRGFGFVIMSSEAEMRQAIKEVNGQSLYNREIIVTDAQGKERRRGV